MLKPIYFILIYFHNFFVHPYFQQLDQINTFWLWVSAFAFYFIVVIGLIMWPVMGFYLKGKNKNIWHVGRLAFLLSAATVFIIVSQVFTLTFVLESLPPIPVLNTELFYISFLTVLILLTSLIIYLLSNYLENRKPLAFKPRKFLITTLPSLMTIGLMIYVFWITGPGFCGDSDKLYRSSGYSGHSVDLCYKRSDKSECPKSKEALRAFRPQDYDKLQICYYPYKGDYGYLLEPRLYQTDFF